MATDRLTAAMRWRLLSVVYTLTIFISATLLFIVQPLFARMALPFLGGAPAVWNTALTFYQAALLAGYAYAHATSAWLAPRWQATLHLLLLLVPFVVLPIHIPAGWAPPQESSPLPWLLMLLCASVGLPFFVVSATSPLLQRWFASTDHPAAADPYFLYAASNLGSMLSLFSYPIFFEPRFDLERQSRLWAVGYGLLVLFISMCALGIIRNRGPRVGENAMEPQAIAPLSGRRRLRWTALALVPSSLMVSVTTFLSTDIAAIPLLWIMPLSLYLLTFILVFAKRPPLSHNLMLLAQPVVLLPFLIAYSAGATRPITMLIALHLITFFVLTMICHGQIARDRPHPRHLTEYYLWISVGGVLGGIFSALLAPILFSNVTEYPLMLVLACLLSSAPVLQKREDDALPTKAWRATSVGPRRWER
jgi:hypothetical protein